GWQFGGREGTVVVGAMIPFDLKGGGALLPVGLAIVRTGIIRAFGSSLRRVLATALRNRFTAFLAGLGATALLQSSTATALMTTSFAAGGFVRSFRRSRSCLERMSARR